MKNDKSEVKSFNKLNALLESMSSKNMKSDVKIKLPQRKQKMDEPKVERENTTDIM